MVTFFIPLTISKSVHMSIIKLFGTFLFYTRKNVINYVKIIKIFDILIPNILKIFYVIILYGSDLISCYKLKLYQTQIIFKNLFKAGVSIRNTLFSICVC